MQKAILRRWLPIGILVLALALVWGTGLNRYLSLDFLRMHYLEWQDQVARHRLLASVLFMAVYVTAVALSLPGGTILTLCGGALFGTIWGAALSVFSATLGATLLFWAARTAFSDLLRKKAGPWMARMQLGFAQDEWSYMFALRFLPIVPFFIVNLVPALLGVRPLVFIVATFVGIIPATSIYSAVGSSLSDVLAQGGELSLQHILTPKLIGSLSALGLIALLPALYKRWKKVRS